MINLILFLSLFQSTFCFVRISSDVEWNAFVQFVTTAGCTSSACPLFNLSRNVSCPVEYLNGGDSTDLNSPLYNKLICNSAGKIIKVGLFGSELPGRSASLHQTSLNRLSALSALQIGGTGNGVGGKFPDIELPLLKHLTISSTTIDGTLPSSLFTKTNLEALSIHRNRLTGSVPDFRTWSALTQLQLFGNDFRGDLRYPSQMLGICIVQYAQFPGNCFTSCTKAGCTCDPPRAQDCRAQTMAPTPKPTPTPTKPIVTPMPTTPLDQQCPCEKGYGKRYSPDWCACCQEKCVKDSLAKEQVCDGEEKLAVGCRVPATSTSAPPTTLTTASSSATVFETTSFDSTSTLSSSNTQETNNTVDETTADSTQTTDDFQTTGTKVMDMESFALSMSSQASFCLVIVCSFVVNLQFIY